MIPKFNIDDTAYLVVKHLLKPNKYIKCKIYTRFNFTILTCTAKWYKFNNLKSWEIITIPNKYKYSIYTENSETSIYSRYNKNQYLEYYDNQLLTVNEYRAVKLNKLSGKKWLNFSQKKFFEFNYLTSFLKK